jgi:TonB-dependent receptor
MPATHRLIASAIAAALALPFAAPGVAQASDPVIQVEGAPGTVIGRIKEAARGVALNGARVRLNGQQAVTERDGSFRLANVAPGRYQLAVDYVGYQGQSIDIEVGSNAGLRLDIVLRSTVDTTMEAIEVRATRDAQALALNQQRASENYKNVVSADLLGRFPDANIAESTQRIPGVSIERDQGEGRYVNVRGAPLEFTSVTLDGATVAAPNASRRAVELDTIPSDVIAALEVTKALTADMDGDAIAGQINIVTQSALNQDDMILRGSLGLGRYELGSGRNERANATIGNRFGPDGNIGLLVSASGSRAGRYTDNVETVFFRAADGRILPELTEIKDYEGDRSRRGLTARLDARLSDDHLVYLIASGSKFRDKEYRNTFTIEYEQHRPEATEDGGVVGRATFDKEIRERIQEQSVRAINGGGEHWFGSWQMDWQAAYSTAKLELPARQQFIYRSSLRPPMRYDFSNPDFPTFTILNPDGSVRQEGINLPESLYNFRRYNDRYERSTEDELGLKLNFTHPQEWIGDSGELKFGLRARLRDKDANDDRRRNSVAADAPAYADLLCPRVSNNFGRFEFGRVFCNSVFRDYAGQMRNANNLLLLEASVVSDYEASEDVYAAFGRLDARWESLSMVAGLRYERTETWGRANLFNTVGAQVTPLEVERDYVKLLPSLHFRYEVDPDTILRWSYSTAISRPNFPDVVPRLVLSDNERAITRGNPDLKATYSQNFDFSVERYIRPLGLLSAAVFFKQLDDPIFTVTQDLTQPGGTPLRLTQPNNGSSGRIQGLELAWQQTFDFLPAPFDGLGVYTNYTYADSSADLPFGIGKTDLPGTSKHNTNLAVFYEKSGFNARLAWNYRSEFIQEFDVGDDELNVYWDERSILDFSTSYQLSANWQLFGEINNITDSRQRRYQGSPNRVLELEQFGRFWLVGARFEF